MKARTLVSVTLVALASIAVPVSAGNGKAHGAKHFGKGIFAHCPPGLAKKNPPCIPPGQAKKIYPGYHPRYNVGDRIYRDYRILRDARRYGLRDDYLYYLVGQEVFRISPETGPVIAFIGLADVLLN